MRGYKLELLAGALAIALGFMLPVHPQAKAAGLASSAHADASASNQE
ncbi:MAG TPA: hypothetical protein PKA57_04825 [Parvibaculum sp.]|nr:hypothetical protein [Parvibaculum sp.]HMM13929.1 hypothetical protein [Parvibaculum sp.]